MTLSLYDTYTRSLRAFEPLRPPEVGVYACGPTVYDYQHVGNMRTYIFSDLLRRVLAFNGYQVRLVINITDVGHLTSDADTGDDKMERRARARGESAWELAARYTEAFREDMRRLNIAEPDVWCRATDHIPEQIAFVRCLEEKGYTYRTADGIYFDTSRLDNYGYLARLDVAGLEAGARVDMGEKRRPTDFALWKFSPADQQRQMEWESPWGVGFPGWHIECSAMAHKYLGPFFDIHCGGEDHISVHHPNEIAQTEGCYGTRLANFWMHGYFLTAEGDKMAKSSGGFLRLQHVIDQGYDPLAFRYYCLNAHYRARLRFNWEGLDGAATALDRLRAAGAEWGAAGEPDPATLSRFREQVNDDLNLPRGLAVTWEMVRSGLPPDVKKGTLLEMDRVLGLGLVTWEPQAAEAPAEIVHIARQRQEARQARRWAEADALRETIRARGYEIEDTPDGFRIRTR